jgi:putative transcriptional regulator
MSERSIAQEILEGLHEIKLHREGKITLREYTISIPDDPTISPAEIIALREKLGYSQPILASMLRVKSATLKNWEQGRSKPNTQATILFRLIEKEPDTLAKIAAL